MSPVRDLCFEAHRLGDESGGERTRFIVIVADGKAEAQVTQHGESAPRAVHQRWLETLVCPENHSPLTAADTGLIARLNEKISSGTLRNRAGTKVDSPIVAGLVRADGALLYPVIDGIPVMLVDEAIPLDQLPGD